MFFSWLTRPIFARKSALAGTSPESALNTALSIARQSDLLSVLVKESMTHMGAVSSSYRFKCIAQDAQATCFIVLIDLPANANVARNKLSDIEVILRRSATSRYNIRMKSIYWRFDNSQKQTAVAPSPGETIKAIDLAGLIEPNPVSVPSNAVSASDDQPTLIAGYEPATSEELIALNRQFSDSGKVPSQPWPDTAIKEDEDESVLVGATQYAKLN
jgi:hypothetical protein